MNSIKIIHVASLCGLLAMVGGLGACERRVVETTKTQDGPNGSKTEKTTVVEHNDGTVTEEKKTQTTENH